ncbi:MAG: RpiB/LacA/LacB family sugar-phosphate isomerase [Patescibacteria group bacterium]
MKIYLGSDHAGFELKEKIKKWLALSQAEGLARYEVVDFGALKFDAQDDYPDFVRPVAQAVANDSEQGRGIILGGSGQGEAMVANRISGARAAVYYGGGEEIIKLSREHNNANILSLGARFINEEEAFKAIKLWLDTPFSGDERHVRRIAKF